MADRGFAAAPRLQLSCAREAEHLEEARIEKDVDRSNVSVDDVEDLDGECGRFRAGTVRSVDGDRR